MSIEVVTLSDAVKKPRRLAVGFFDGVHLGHRKVIEGADTVLTFDPHPLVVLRHDAAPKMLTPRALKARLLEELGVKEMVLIEFDQEFSQIGAERFVNEVLIERLGAVDVSVGENFRFGAKAGGDAEYLGRFEQFRTHVVPLVESDGEIVSSTQIRGLVAAGDIARADQLLGYPFTMVGEVIHGDKRGRTLGFPTANLAPGEHDAVPGHGVYAALTDGVASAVNVGVRPTFQTGRGVLVESYLVDWAGDLYGSEVEIQFLKRLRGEKRFESVDELVAQMHRDAEEASQICAARAAREA
jgi:riboflavin kinase/FMN adenylyltransferase